MEQRAESKEQRAENLRVRKIPEITISIGCNLMQPGTTQTS
jgi:hypothetical protein